MDILRVFAETKVLKGVCGTSFFVYGSDEALEAFFNAFHQNFKLEYQSGTSEAAGGKHIKISLDESKHKSDQQVDIITDIHGAIGASIWGGNWFAKLMK